MHVTVVLFIPYPTIHASSVIIGGNNSSIYHLADQVSAGNLNYLTQTLVGATQQIMC